MAGMRRSTVSKRDKILVGDDGVSLVDLNSGIFHKEKFVRPE